ARPRARPVRHDSTRQLRRARGDDGSHGAADRAASRGHASRRDEDLARRRPAREPAADRAEAGPGGRSLVASDERARLLARVKGDSSLLTFPCELPIKVLGRNEAAFREAAIAIVRAHYGDEHRVAEQLSREGSYLSLTITVRAASREQIDAVYNDLVAAPQVMMVL